LACQSGREADHSLPSSAEVKEWVELYLRSPIRLHGVVLRGSTGTFNYTVIRREFDSTVTWLFVHYVVQHLRWKQLVWSDYASGCSPTQTTWQY
jgi:hypothetical protein